jgi:anti-anti-sigma regulatory factor
MALPRTKHAPFLTIAMIDDERIDAVVAGDFDEGCPEKMLDRLDRLARCRTQRLRIDLSGILHLDERVARVFADAAESVGRNGGRIEFVGVSAEVEGVLGAAMCSRGDEPVASGTGRAR